MTALHWLIEGYYYEITSADVLDAYTHTMAAAENSGDVATVSQWIQERVLQKSGTDNFVCNVLSRKLRVK